MVRDNRSGIGVETKQTWCSGCDKDESEEVLEKVVMSDIVSMEGMWLGHNQECQP